MPRKSTNPDDLPHLSINLDDKLKRLEEISKNNPSFPPTNFYVQWPQQGKGNNNSNNNNSANNATANWLSPDDLIPQPWAPLSSRDLPAPPSSHRKLIKPKKLQDKLQNTIDYNSTAYSQPIQSAAFSSTVLNTVKPNLNNSFQSVTNISIGPSVGAYNISYNSIENKPAAHQFSSVPRHLSWNIQDIGTNNNSNVKPNNNNPSATIPPLISNLPSAALPSSQANSGSFMSKSTRFEYEKLESKEFTPAASSYNINWGAVESEAYNTHTFSGRREFEAVHYTKRDRGPDMASYNTEVKEYRLPHKFQTTPRFVAGDVTNTQLSKLKLIAPANCSLILSDARRRNTAIKALVKPDLNAYTANRRAEAIGQAKVKRETKLLSLEQFQISQHKEHAEKVDRIVNKEKYRELARIQLEEAKFKQKVIAGWLVYSALASRSNIFHQLLKQHRLRVHLRLLANKAARTIQKFCLKWIADFRRRKFLKNGAIILRAMRRNVVRSHLRKKRAAARIIARSVRNWNNKQFALQAMRKYINFAVKIQRAWRRHKICREMGELLVERQWLREEDDIAQRYQQEAGEETYEKLRKKGLLLKNVSLTEQKKKIIIETEFRSVPQELRRRLIRENYEERLAQHKEITKQFKLRLEYKDKLGDLGNFEQRNATSEGAGAELLAALLSAGTDPAHPPHFTILLPTAKLFQLLTTAHIKLGLSKDIRAAYKRIINSLLKNYAAKAKAKMARVNKLYKQLANNPANLVDNAEAASAWS
jgi:hypothetical protein